MAEGDAGRPALLLLGERDAARPLVPPLAEAFDVRLLGLDASSQVLHDPVDLVALLADPKLDLPAEVQALAMRVAPAAVPLVVLAAPRDPAEEAALFANGASDVVSPSSQPAVLRARLRLQIDAAAYRRSQGGGLFESFFDQSPYVLSIRDVSGRYLAVNRAVGEVLGAAPDAFIGRRREDAPVHEDRIGHMDAEVRARLEPCSYHRTFNTPAGARSLRIVAFPIIGTDGEPIAVGRIGIDLTGASDDQALREESRAERKRQEAMFSAFVENVPALISLRDIDGRYTMVNRLLAEYLGREPGDILGSTNAELGCLDAATVAAATAHDRTVLETGDTVAMARRDVDGAGRATDRWITGFPVLDPDCTVIGIGTISMDMTDLVQARRDLDDRERSFTSLVEGSIQGIAIHRDRRLLFVNQAFVDILGYGSARDLLAVGSVGDLVAPRDRKLLLARAAARARGGTVPSRYEYTALRKDGSEVVLQCLVNMTVWEGAPATQIAVLDITEQREMVDALRASEARFSAFFEKSPYPMAIQDVAGHYAVLNDAVRETYGLGDEAFIGAQPMTAMGGVGARNADAATRAVRDSRETASYEFTMIVGEEEKLVAATKFPIVDESGNLLGLGTISADITERRAKDRRLDEYQSELRRLASSVAHAAEEERRRIATELHDGAVQNLGLARIRLGLLLKTHPEAAEPLGELGDLIATATRELRSLMSELSPPLLYELGLQPAAEWLARRIESQFGIECRVVPGDAAPRLTDDRSTMLFQSIRELLMNVVKHAGATRADIVFRLDDGALEVVVMDDGCGIAPSRTALRPTDTGGFGLFNVRERLRLMDGELTIEAPPGGGTHVTLRLPLA